MIVFFVFSHGPCAEWDLHTVSQVSLICVPSFESYEKVQISFRTRIWIQRCDPGLETHDPLPQVPHVKPLGSHGFSARIFSNKGVRVSITLVWKWFKMIFEFQNHDLSKEIQASKSSQVKSHYYHPEHTDPILNKDLPYMSSFKVSDFVTPST